ncbi:MAG: LysM domain-containing protein, partial [Thermoleophilia bacterium]
PSRPRPAATPGAGRLVARIAAPVVFLVAVIALVSIVASSGIVGGDEPAPGSSASPTPRATGTKPGAQPTKAAVKRYVIKSGDTLSGIAAKFDVTVSDILELNPDLSGSTLPVGEKVKIPTQ